MIFGWEHTLVSISILMQLSVAAMAIKQAVQSVEKHRVTWSMLALVFGLMSFRRMVSLGIALGIDIPFAFPEIVAFVISLLLCIAVWNIGKILPALQYVVNQMPDTSEQLKDIATQLSSELQVDMENIDEFMANGDGLQQSKESLQNASKKLVDIAHNLERITSGEQQQRGVDGE